MASVTVEDPEALMTRHSTIIPKDITTITRMLSKLEYARASFTEETPPREVIENLNDVEALRGHLEKLVQEFAHELQRGQKMKWWIGLNPLVEKLLDIQKDSAIAIGASAVVGANTAITLMYSATRGDMWYPYIAWYLFVISMTVTFGLSLLSSGSKSHTKRNPDVFKSTSKIPHLLLGLSAVALSLIGAVGGWAALVAGTIRYNIHSELHGSNAALSGGPDHGTKGIGLASRAGAYVVVGCFVLFLTLSYFIRLQHTMRVNLLESFQPL